MPFRNGINEDDSIAIALFWWTTEDVRQHYLGGPVSSGSPSVELQSTRRAQHEDFRDMQPSVLLGVHKRLESNTFKKPTYYLAGANSVKRKLN